MCQCKSANISLCQAKPWPSATMAEVEALTESGTVANASVAPVDTTAATLATTSAAEPAANWAVGNLLAGKNFGVQPGVQPRAAQQQPRRASQPTLHPVTHPALPSLPMPHPTSGQFGGNRHQNKGQNCWSSFAASDAHSTHTLGPGDIYAIVPNLRSNKLSDQGHRLPFVRMGGA